MINIILILLLIFAVFNSQNLWFYLLLGISTVLIYLFISGKNDIKSNDKKDIDYNNNCTEPTFSNPYMNVLYSKENPHVPACEYKDHEKKIKDYYRYNLYEDLRDIFSYNSTERQFYTMPVTTVPNNLNNFAKWLYKTKTNCKNNGDNCLEYINKRYNST